MCGASQPNTVLLKPVLADLSVATSDDTTTWFDLRTALGAP